MESLRGRLDVLTKEIRDLGRELEERNSEIVRLRARTREQSEKIREKDASLEELGATVSKLRGQVDDKNRKIRSRERVIRSECRRKELLNRKILGSSKSRGDYLISLEMKILNERFEIMKKFILALSERIGFDFEVFNELVKISEGFEDPIISAFLDAVSPSKSLCEGED